MRLPAALLLLPCLLEEPPPPKPPPPPPAAKVVAAIARAARENTALPPEKRVAGDALGNLYVRRAAAAAEGDARTFILGLEHALDPERTLARLPLTAPALKGVETEEESKARLRDLGKPTMRGRNDWLLHFTVSAALRVCGSEALAESAGIAKEATDAQAGTGFSFADLLADLAGIRFAGWLLERDSAARLKRVAEGFAGEEFLPDPSKEPEGLKAAEFRERFGSVTDERFIAKKRSMAEAVAALAVYRAERDPGSGPK